MKAHGHQVSLLHSGMDPLERDRIIDEYRVGKSKVMIATNVLSRGIDVRSVSMVINYDLPTDHQGRPDFDTYIHRIGRCGRFSSQGISISFIENAKTWQHLEEIHRHFGMPICMIPADDIMVSDELFIDSLMSDIHAYILILGM